MKRSSIVGFALIGIILLGFSWYNSVQFNKRQREAFVADSIAAARLAEQMRAEQAASGIADSAAAFAGQPQGQQSVAEPAVYKDSLMEAAFRKPAEYFTIENDKLSVDFTTKGAQMYSALIKPYYRYDSTALYFIRPGKSNYNVRFFTDQSISTEDLVFDLAEKTDTSITMRLNFQNGGYLEQKYWLEPGSFVVKNNTALVGMGGIIPRNGTALDIDWELDVTRIQESYKTRTRYSRMDFKYPGEKKIEKLGKNGRDVVDERIGTRISWFTFQQHFFSAFMVSDKDFSSGEFSMVFHEENDPDSTLMACAANVSVDYDPGQRVDYPFDFYIGPNHYQTLKASGDGFENIVQLGGWLASKINKWVIIPFFNWLHEYIASFGIIILLMTICIKLVLSPLTFKSYSSSAKMGVIKPEVDKLNAKYPKPEDAMKKQQALMELYKRAGISPMGGCLPMLLQLPILYAMFRFFPTSFELRQQGFLWVDDLSTYDSIWDFGFRIPLLGDHLSLLSLLMAVSMFLYSKINSAQMSSDPSMKSMKFMTLWLMPIMMFFICNNLSSGLSYYYMLSNIITILQTWIIKRFFIDENKIHARLEAKASEPVKKSKFMQRLEAAQKAQEQAMRQQVREQSKKMRR